jgi:hypothetical protein
MKTFWESEEEGNYVAVVDMEDGSGQQRFEGATHKEVADKMMVAQANATALIKTQATKIKETTPVEHAKPVTEFKAKPLSADERLEVTTDLSDATKAPEAVKRIVESALGAPLDTVRERLGAQQEAESARRLLQSRPISCRPRGTLSTGLRAGDSSAVPPSRKSDPEVHAQADQRDVR